VRNHQQNNGVNLQFSSKTLYGIAVGLPIVIASFFYVAIIVINGYTHSQDGWSIGGLMVIFGGIPLLAVGALFIGLIAFPSIQRGLVLLALYLFTVGVVAFIVDFLDYYDWIV